MHDEKGRGGEEAAGNTKKRGRGQEGTMIWLD